MKKPKKPYYDNNRQIFEKFLYGSCTIVELNTAAENFAKDTGYSIESVEIMVTIDDIEFEPCLCISIEESKEHYDKRYENFKKDLKQYEKDVKAYNQYIRDNKDHKEVEKRQQKLEVKRRQLEKITREIEDLNKGL